VKVCVIGLWHLGSVTAACLASGGHEVVGFDFDASAVQSLQAGKPPVYEPGLEELLQRGLAAGRLRFTTDAAEALQGADIAWVAYDTPVDGEDRADVDCVVERIARLFPHLAAGALVLISSQIPVGTTRRLEQMVAEAWPRKPIAFGYSPENLRLGSAIRAFAQPDRVVVGIRGVADRVAWKSCFGQ